MQPVKPREPWGVAALCLALAACGGSDDAGTENLDPSDAAPPEDMRHEASVWDALHEAGFVPPPADQGFTPDAAPPSCLSEGAALLAQPVGDPIPGLASFRADVDADGDALPDLVLSIDAGGGSELRLLKGTDASPLGSFAAGLGRRLSLVPAGYPAPDLVTPVEVAGTPAFWILDRGAPTATLRALAAGDFRQVASLDLGGEADDVVIVPGGRDGAGVALINRPDGGCAQADLGSADPPAGGGTCRIAPGWDLNGDTLVDILVSAAAGVTVLDAATLDPIGQVGGTNVVLGFNPPTLAAAGPTPGPTDPRGEGAEIVSARMDRGTVRVAYHDPATLMQNAEAAPVNADFLQARFWPSTAGLRLITEAQRAAVHLINIYELEHLQSRNELGPYVNVAWSGGFDVNSDGYEDMAVRFGPREDGVNSDLEFRDAADGNVLLEVASEQSARFDPVLRRQEGLWRLADVDGCEGDELVLIRGGLPQPTGARPSRLQVFVPGGRRLFQTDSKTGLLHQAVLADLDGLPPHEIVELRSEGEGAALLTVYRAP